MIGRIYNKVVSRFRNRSVDLNEKLSALIAGSINQSQLLDNKLSALIEGLANHSQLFNDKLSVLIEKSTVQCDLEKDNLREAQLQTGKLLSLIEGSDNQTRLMNEKLSALVEGLSNQSHMLNDRLLAFAEGLSNQSRLLNDRLSELVEGISSQSQLLSDRLPELIEGLNNQSQLINGRLSTLIEQSAHQSQFQDDRLLDLIQAFSQSELLNERASALAAQSAHRLSALVEQSAGHARRQDEKMNALIQGMDNQSQLFEAKLSAVVEGSINQTRALTERLSALIEASNNQSQLFSSTFARVESVLATYSDAESQHVETSRLLVELGRTQVAMQTEEIGLLQTAIDRLADGRSITNNMTRNRSSAGAANKLRGSRSLSSKATLRQHGILVLGMHRSGTSALTRVLNIIGAQLPSHLAKPSNWNERGFFESTKIIDIHDDMLKSVSSKWDDSSRIEFDLKSRVVRQFRNRLKDLLQQEFEAAPIFVVKDPRICRFVPFWLSLFEEMDVVPHAALIVRNPLEVARSLQERDGLTPSQSYSLWLRHVLDSERATRGVSRGIVLYEKLLSAWRLTINQLVTDIDLPSMKPSLASSALIDQFLSPSLRHHSIDASLLYSPDVSGSLRGTFTALSELAGGADDPQTWRKLDAVAKALDGKESLSPE